VVTIGKHATIYLPALNPSLAAEGPISPHVTQTLAMLSKQPELRLLELLLRRFFHDLATGRQAEEAAQRNRATGRRVRVQRTHDNDLRQLSFTKVKVYSTAVVSAEPPYPSDYNELHTLRATPMFYNASQFDSCSIFRETGGFQGRAPVEYGQLRLIMRCTEQSKWIQCVLEHTTPGA
jgi:hypothetical protein